MPLSKDRGLETSISSLGDETEFVIDLCEVS